MTDTETCHSIVASSSENSIEEKQIIDQLIFAIENIIDSMEDEKNEKKIGKFSKEEKLFNLAAKSRTFTFLPNYNKNRLIAGAAPKIDGFRTIKDVMPEIMSRSKPPSTKAKKPKKVKPTIDEKPKEVKSKDDSKDTKEPNFDDILTICADILNGNPCGVSKKEEKYISAFGCCGYLSHQGKPVFKDPTDYSSIITTFGGKGGGGKEGDGEPTDIFKMEMPAELQKMVSGQKKVEHAEKQRAEREEKRRVAFEKGLDPDKDLDENGDPIVTDETGGPGGIDGNDGVGGKGGIGGGSQPKLKVGKALMKDISKKRDKLITDEKLFNKKMDELNSKLKNALIYQKLIREGSRPKYRTDVTIHEWLMIIFGAKSVRRPVCRPCGDCCHMNCIC